MKIQSQSNIDSSMLVYNFKIIPESINAFSYFIKGKIKERVFVKTKPELSKFILINFKYLLHTTDYCRSSIFCNKSKASQSIYFH